MNFVYKHTDGCRDFRFVDQIRDASVSVMSNVAEGFESLTNKQFIRYLGIAKASAGEVRSHLYVALDRAYVNSSAFEQGYQLSTTASKQLWRLIMYLQKNEVARRRRTKVS